MYNVADVAYLYHVATNTKPVLNTEMEKVRAQHPRPKITKNTDGIPSIDDIIQMDIHIITED